MMDPSLEDWNPMQDDYNRVGFNSYDQGPGRFIPSFRQGDPIQLYITGIPHELTEEGLVNLFGQCGEVVHANKAQSRSSVHKGTFGFVHYKTLNEANEAIRLLNRKPFNGGEYRLKVEFAMSPQEKQARIREQRLGLPLEEDLAVGTDRRIVMDKQDQNTMSAPDSVKPPHFPAGRGSTNSLERQPGQRNPENGHSSGYDSGDRSLGLGQSAGPHSNSSSVSHLSTGSHADDLSETSTLKDIDELNRAGAAMGLGRGRGYHQQHEPHQPGSRQDPGRGRGYVQESGRGGRPGGQTGRGYVQESGRGGRPGGQTDRGARGHHRGRGFHIPGPRGSMSGDPRQQYSPHGTMQGVAPFLHNTPGHMTSHDQDETSSICSSMVDKLCRTCGKPARERCKRCKVIYYCSRNCQHEDWPTHRVMCRDSFQGGCRFWMIFGTCGWEECPHSHNASQRGQCAHMRGDALFLGMLTPVMDSQCLFWRVQGECRQAHRCPYEHLQSTQGADMDCNYWRSGHCINGENCDFAHFPDNYGIDRPLPGTECRYWRTGGCRHGAECKWLHLPDSQGIDHNAWQAKQNARQAEASVQSETSPGLPDNLRLPPPLGENEGSQDQYQDFEGFVSKLGFAQNLKVKVDGSDKRSVGCAGSPPLDEEDLAPGCGEEVEQDPGPPDLEVITSDLEDTTLTDEPKSPFESRFEVSCDADSFMRGALKKADSSTFRGRIKFSDVKCDSLLEGVATKVLVTHFEHPGKFYLCKTETVQAAVNLMGELLKAYEGSGCPSYTPEKKELIAARFEEDGSWYRARVDAIDLDGVIRVTYVDYGNCDELHASQVRRLRPEFINLPIQGMLCGLDLSPCGSQWCTEARELCLTELMPPMCGTEIKASLIRVSGDHQIVDLVDTSVDTSVAQVLLSKKLAHKVRPGATAGTAAAATAERENVGGKEAQTERIPAPQIEAVPAPILPPPPITTLPLPTAAKSLKPGDMLTLQVLEVVSPSQFYIQVLGDDLKQLEPLSESLQVHYGKLAPKKDFRVNTDKLYACKFTADGLWYRALAYDFSPSRVVVQYLDYANYEAVPFSHLHPLEGDHRSLQLQAVCCSLVAIQGVDGEWSAAATEYLRELTSEQTLHGLIAQKDDTQIHIEIVTSNQQSINELMIEKGFAKEKVDSNTTQKEAAAVQSEAVTYLKMSDLPAVDLGSDKEFSVQVTHAPSPTELVVQILDPGHPMLLHCVELTQRLLDIREAAYRPVSVGELVCARYEEDESWYRAEVVSISQHKTQVCFVDYGNVEEVAFSSICKLPEDLLAYPCVGIPCTLSGIQGVAPGASWDPNLLQPMAKSWTLKIHSGDPCSGFVVDLCDSEDGKSLNKELLEKGIVEQLNASDTATVKSSPPSIVSKDDNLPKVTHSSFKQEVSTACVLHFVGPQEMYMSCLDDEDLVEKYIELSVQLNTAYTHSVDVYSSPKQGELVAVFSREFQEWYRGQVVSIKQKTVIVNCVDYGNRIECNVEDIRKLKPEFISQPSQVIRCSLFGLDNDTVRWSGKAIERLETLTSGIRLKVRAEGMRGESVVITELIRESDEVDLVNLLVQEGCLRKENVGRESHIKSGAQNVAGSSEGQKKEDSGTSSVVPADQHVTVMSAEVPVQTVPQEQVTVEIVHADSLDSFYVQLKTDELCAKRERMQKELNTRVAKQQAYIPQSGELVAALFESDWSRAEVTAVKPDGTQAKIVFIDFGNSAQMDTKHIRKLGRNHADLPKQAVRCCLSGIRGNKGNGSWSKEAEEFFQAKILGKTLTLKVSGGAVAGCHSVDLVSPKNQLLTEIMVERALAEPKPAPQRPTGATGGGRPTKPAPKVIKHHVTANPPPAQRVVSSPTRAKVKAKDLGTATIGTDSCIVMVTDVVSPLSFTAMKIDELPELTDLGERITAYCQETHADLGLNLTPGDLCCALFAADGQWYRAEVTDMLSPAQLEVRFIDYGNMEKQDLANLRPFKQEFMGLKAQGIKCALKGVPEQVVIPVPVCEELGALVKEKLSVCVLDGGRGAVSVVSLTSHGTEPVIDINTAIHDLLKETAPPSNVSALDENEALRRELAELRAKMEQMAKGN